MNSTLNTEADADLSDPGVYGHWTRDIIRFADLDPLNHVNNVAFSTFFESGRVKYLADHGPSVDDPKFGWMAVRLCIDFTGQLNYPGSVDIGSRTMRLGRSTVVVGSGLFEDGRCAATAECVMVLVDRSTNSSTELPGDLRRTLLDSNPG